MVLSIVDIQAYWRLFLISENKLTGKCLKKRLICPKIAIVFDVGEQQNYFMGTLAEQEIPTLYGHFIPH